MVTFTEMDSFIKNEGGFAFFENPLLGITVTDENATVIRVNKSQERITGLSDWWVGKNFKELIGEGKVNASSSVQVIKHKKEITLNQKLYNSRSYLVQGFPIFDKNSKLRYILSYLLDFSAVQDMRAKLGAFDLKPESLSPPTLTGKCEQAIIYNSVKMQDIIDRVHMVATSDASVFITGESGVGKEAIANLIHECSDRNNGPFIKINCSAIPDTLLDSELFGYESGTFTGGNKNGKMGLLEKAHGGTMFFDEIGDMPLKLQAKLLRVLQEKEVRRLGGHKIVEVDIRVVAATNANMVNMVKAQRFRKDLYYRLNVIPIRVPALHERKEDIPLLIQHFTGLLNNKYGKSKEFDISAVGTLLNSRLDGNIRQLKNIVERLVLLSPGNIITVQDVEGSMFDDEARATRPDKSNVAAMPVNNRPFKDILEEQEAQVLRNYYHQYKSSYKIANLLKTNQSTIWRKLKKYQIC